MPFTMMVVVVVFTFVYACIFNMQVCPAKREKYVVDTETRSQESWLCHACSRKNVEGRKDIVLGLDVDESRKRKRIVSQRVVLVSWFLNTHG